MAKGAMMRTVATVKDLGMRGQGRTVVDESTVRPETGCVQQGHKKDGVGLHLRRPNRHQEQAVGNKATRC